MKYVRKSKLLIVLALSLLIANLLPFGYAQSATTTLKVHYIDVGESDCTLIQYGSKYMMIDAGDTDDTDTVLDYLEDKKVKKLEYLILTHPHADHIGSAADVIKEYSIGKIIMPAKEHTTKTYEEVLNAIKDKKLKITKPIVGDSYNLGTAKFTILAPNNYDYGSNINDYSIGIKLTYNKTKFVFIGDCETDAISDILDNKIDLSADVYQCGHHGSDTSTTEDLLKAINPKYAIISVGKNSYGHPTDSTLKLLSDNKIKTYRTDESGTIVVTSTGKKISINAEEFKYKSTTSDTKDSNNADKDTSNSNVTYVYVTETGSKYHKEGCRYLKDSMIKIKLTDAVEKDYEPCSVCN